MATIESVVLAVAGRVPVSAALGELAAPLALPAGLAGQLQFAKFGLAGCAPWPDWRLRWQAEIGRLPRGVSPVGVVYADWRAAKAPSPREVFEQAFCWNCRGILFDTFDKSGGPLTSHMGLSELAKWIEVVKRQSLIAVVAGSLGVDEIAAVIRLAPDYVAVRGAACSPDRTGPLVAARVRALAAAVRESTAPRIDSRQLSK